MWLTLAPAPMALALFVVMLLTMRLGTRFALAHDTRTEEELRRGTGAIEGAVFALLGLLLAFADYVDARLSGFRLLPPSEAWVQFAAAKTLQQRIWSMAVEACHQAEQSAITPFVLSTINDMIDVAITREVSLTAHPPAIMFVLLATLAAACSMLADRSIASRRMNKKSYRVGFSLVFAFTFMIVIDAEYSRAGFVQIGQVDDLLVKCRQAMNASGPQAAEPSLHSTP